MERNRSGIPRHGIVEKSTYEAPKLVEFGPVTITAMPGGSLGIEGNSGKSHPFATGEDEDIHG